MKALTLTQPWASAVAVGAKRIETRSWQTSYRGPVAIHAAKGWTAQDRELAACELFRQILAPFGVRYTSAPPEHWYHCAHYRYVSGLPLGAIVAVARIVDVRPTNVLRAGLSDVEERLGDYEAGRFGWLLADVVPVRSPIPCRGALGLWTVPDDVVAGLAVRS